MVRAQDTPLITSRLALPLWFLERDQVMRLFKYSVFVNADLAATFRVIADPRSKMLWVPGIRRVELESAGTIGAGTRYLASSGMGPLEFPFHEQILEWVENERVTYEGISPWGTFRATASLEPEQAGTRLNYQMDFFPPAGRLGSAILQGLSVLLRPLMQGRAQRRFRRVVENGLWQPGDTWM